MADVRRVEEELGALRPAGEGGEPGRVVPERLGVVGAGDERAAASGRAHAPERQVDAAGVRRAAGGHERETEKPIHRHADSRPRR